MNYSCDTSKQFLYYTPPAFLFLPHNYCMWFWTFKKFYQVILFTNSCNFEGFLSWSNVFFVTSICTSHFKILYMLIWQNFLRQVAKCQQSFAVVMRFMKLFTKIHNTQPQPISFNIVLHKLEHTSWVSEAMPCIVLC